MDAFKVVWNQFLKNVDKAPGWVPLLVAVLLWLQLSGVPEKIEIRGRTIPLSAEIIASVITFFLYKLGDAIDERVFKECRDGKTETKPRYKNAYKDESSDAQTELGVGENGLYALASTLTAAAEKAREVPFVYLFNEGAKFLRSLIVPLGIFGILCLLSRQFVGGVLLLMSSVIALTLYPWVKVEHIRRLYRSAALNAKKKQFAYKDTNGVRLYFWDGKYITVGLINSSTVESAN